MRSRRERRAGAAFVASCEDLLCSFADRSTDADGTLAAWTWSFGAGTASGATPSFAFAAPGTYPVTLTVADDDGAMSTVTIPVEVIGRARAYSGNLEMSSRVERRSSGARVSGPFTG